jgi:predicted ATPase
MKEKQERRRACVHTVRVWDERWLKRFGGPDEGKKSRRFDFKPGVNLIVGPNGSGKSSLLELIWNNIAVKRKDRRGMAMFCDPGLFRRFDFEKDNPRGRTEGLMMMELSAIQMHFASTSHSHGETTAKLLEMLARDQQRHFRAYLFDEPEQALDPVGLMVLRQQLLHTGARQVILATHALPLILEPSFHVVELRLGYRRELAVAIMDYAAQAAEIL